MTQPDHRRIHQLEFDLGFRDDPPPPRHTDEPGSIIYWNPSHEARPNYIALNEDARWGFEIDNCRFVES